MIIGKDVCIPSYQAPDDMPSLCSVAAQYNSEAPLGWLLDVDAPGVHMWLAGPGSDDCRPAAAAAGKRRPSQT